MTARLLFRSTKPPESPGFGARCRQKERYQYIFENGLGWNRGLRLSQVVLTGESEGSNGERGEVIIWRRRTAFGTLTPDVLSNSINDVWSAHITLMLYDR